MNDKLVLTGATNNPGRVLVDYIAENRDKINELFPGGIVSVFRASSDTYHFKCSLPDAEIATCDLTDVEGLKTAFRGADTVLHMAGIHWSREVATAVAACRVRRLIVIHTCGIYSKYKAAGEEYRQIDECVEKTCKKSNIILTILRPTMIYGNSRDRNVIKFIKLVDKFPIMPVVNGARYELQPVHYADLGKAFFNVLVNEEITSGKDFILSGEKPILLRDMFTEIGKNLGKDVKFISCPFWIAYPGAIVVWAVSLGKIDFREKVQRLCEDRAFPHEEATKAFGFAPRSFEDGIVNEVREYKRR